MFFCCVYTVTSGTFGQDLSENMGLRSLNERLQDPSLAAWFGNLFPRDSPRNMRFSINFFTSIGLGGITDQMRAHLAVSQRLRSLVVWACREEWGEENLAKKVAFCAGLASLPKTREVNWPGLCRGRGEGVNLLNTSIRQAANGDGDTRGEADGPSV